MSLRDDINEAVKEGPIPDFEFLRLTKWEATLNRIADRFLKHGTRDLQSVWLWEEFGEPISAEQAADSLASLRGCLVSAERYWLIASDESGKYWVADATGEAVVRTVEEMYCFEYYVVDRRMNWILCENHHGVSVRAVAGDSNGEPEDGRGR